jgi:hypothetical protein
MTAAKGFPMPHPTSIRPSPYTPPTREQIERARAMYAEGFTVSRVLAATDMSLGTLYYWLGGGPMEGGAPLYPAIPRRRLVVGKRRPPPSADRASLAARLFRTAERQARDIEERLARPGTASPERERDVRMLALLVRSLRDLDGFSAAAEIKPQAAGLNDEDIPDKYRELRAALLHQADENMAMSRELVRAFSATHALHKELTRQKGEKEKQEHGEAESRVQLVRTFQGLIEAAQREREAGQAGGG